LHLGNARTLALAWWWARARGAELVLRIEDLDHPRKKPGAIEELRADLAWLGLDFDRETPLQTLRAARHEALLADLLRRGLAYPCVCTRRDVEEAASAPHETPGETAYRGVCRGRFADVAKAARVAGRPPAIRFRVDPRPERFDDFLAGPQERDAAAEGGDFVIGRADADLSLRPGYQLAVVVDDEDDGVTHVLRGADLLPSVARQRALQRALGFRALEYGHAALVVGPDGRRLAKRHGDTRLSALRDAGISAAAIWRWIATSIGFPPLPPSELVRRGFPAVDLPAAPLVPPAELWGR
jgi:glutamyl-tRNA synthetase